MTQTCPHGRTGNCPVSCNAFLGAPHSGCEGSARHGEVGEIGERIKPRGRYSAYSGGEQEEEKQETPTLHIDYVPVGIGILLPQLVSNKADGRVVKHYESLIEDENAIDRGARNY